MLLAAAALIAASAGALAQTADLPVVRLESVYGQQTSSSSSFPVTRLEEPGGSDLDRVAAGSLTFSQPLPIRDVLLLLFRGTPFSVTFDPEVGGSFAGELSDVTLRQALEAVLIPAGLDFERRGPVVRVFPRRTETRLFEVSHVDVKRVWKRRMTGADDGTGAAADLTGTVESDFFGELSVGIQTLLSPSGRAHVDRNAGVVQVTDFPDRLQQVGVYIETVTLRATRQVRLVAHVLDVTLTEKASIDWAAVARSAGITMGSSAGVHVKDVNGLLQAIAAYGSVHIVGMPQVVATNNQPAVMRIGSDSAGFEMASRTAADRRASTSLTLSITPQISADGIVQMTVSPSYADEGRSGRVTELDTVMRVRGGETAIVAGLIRDRTEAVASGGLSGVFGGRDRRTTRRELVVLLTPTVVTVGAVPAAGVQ